uniref:Peptidase A1 domain-containing protein n=1 Tax=Oryza meridionalis TaxID=40149 RepID=A0A0E0CAU4_9ORYZ
MADRITVLAIALLVLISSPQMAVQGKPAAGNTASPRPKQQRLGNFFKKHGSDMAGLFPRHRNGGSSATSCGCSARRAPPAAATSAPPFYAFLSSTIREVRCANRGCQRLVPQTCSADDSPCGYSYVYGGGAANTTAGLLAVDAFAFATVRADGEVFGCAVATEGDIGGVIGLGRGELSLVSQLQIGRFSYYLAPDDAVDVESFILFLDNA